MNRIGIPIADLLRSHDLGDALEQLTLKQFAWLNQSTREAGVPKKQPASNSNGK